MSFTTKLTWAAERVIHAAGSAAESVVKARKPAGVRLTQYQSWRETKWPVGNILAALDQHETGDFADSAQLSAAFGRDDRITACRNTRVRALIGRNGASFQVTASEEGDQRRAGMVGERITDLWPRCLTEDVLSRVQGDAVDLGVSISRIHWYRSLGSASQWLPRLEPWSMEWIRWDHTRGCYLALTQQGEVEVTQGTGEWFILEPGGYQSWMMGAVRALAMLFFFRSMTWKDWARYCEKHGVPILAIDEPPAKGDAAASSAKTSFFAQLKRIGREGVLRLPTSADGKKGYDARIIEPRSLSWPAFQAFLERVDTCIAILYLGQNLSTEVQGGSLAASISQNRVRLDYLAADAEGLATALRSQVWMHWGRFNFDWWDDAITPWGAWSTTEPEDQKSKSVTVLNLSKAIDTFRTAKSPVDERALLESYGIPLLTLDEIAKREEAAKKAAETPAPKTTEPADKADEKTTDDSAEQVAALARTVRRLEERDEVTAAEVQRSISGLRQLNDRVCVVETDSKQTQALVRTLSVSVENTSALCARTFGDFLTKLDEVAATGEQRATIADARLVALETESGQMKRCQEVFSRTQTKTERCVERLGSRVEVIELAEKSRLQATAPKKDDTDG